MATTQNTFTGDGSNLGPFSFTFKWLESTDIKVTVAGVLKTAGTHYNLQGLNYTTKTGGQVLFTAGNAPANGAAIVVYRQTDDSDLAATFYSGSAIRAQDLNNNFVQGLYVTQESSNNATTAIGTANTALTNSNTAISTANGAVSTANTASTNASAAVATANTANTNASAAVSTANTANTNATAAVNTANTASSNASTALSTANTALSTANTASTNATTAISTANTASTNASAAVSTANTAASNASAAVSTANTASSNASTALSTANTAISTANAAASAVANAILYDIVANVAAIPASPANNDAVEVTDSTGIQSFTPLTGMPVGFVGSSGLSVRLVYTTTGSTWNWIQYFPNDPETRYLKLGSTGTVTSTMLADGTIVNADINASAAIAGTKISPDFGSQNVTTTGTVTGASLNPTSSTVPANGVYLPAANTVGISTNSSERIRIGANGEVGIGGANYGTSGQVLTSGGSGAAPSWQTLSVSANSITQGNTSATVTDTGSDGRFVVTTEGSERARVDSSGRLLVGTSSARANFYNAGVSSQNQIEGTTDQTSSVAIIQNYNAATYGAQLILAKSNALSIGSNTLVASGDACGRVTFQGNDGADFVEAARIEGVIDGTPGANDMPGRLVFSTTADGASSPTERMRITNQGYLYSGVTSAEGINSAQAVTGERIVNINSDTLSDQAASHMARQGNSDNAGTAQSCYLAYYRDAIATAPGAFFKGYRGSAGTNGTIRIKINSDGNITNSNNSYGSLSDVKLKENIVDASSQWSDIKSLRVRNYNFKEETGQQTHRQIGLIAQEVEPISPGLVVDFPDANDEVTKTINYSVLYMKAVKALQEAMERIETLEAKVAALESPTTALEIPVDPSSTDT